MAAWAELAEGTDVRAVLASEAMQRALADSLRWDPRLPYVRREAAECLLIRRRADALQARGAGSAT